MTTQLKYYGYVVLPHYVQGIQNAVQASHAIAELVARNTADPWVKTWVNRDKSLIILRCGECSELETIQRDLRTLHLDHFDFSQAHTMPVHIFKEPGLNNSMTALATVLPKFTDDEFVPYTREEAALLKITKYMEKFRLAT